MALRNPETNQYYRIVSFHPFKRAMEIQIYNNQAHRNDGDTQNILMQMKQIRFKGFAPFQNMADSSKSIKDNFLSAAYGLLKSLENGVDDWEGEDFKNFIDV